MKKGRTTSLSGHRTVVTATIIYGTFLFGWTPACCLFILTAEVHSSLHFSCWVRDQASYSGYAPSRCEAIMVWSCILHFDAMHDSKNHH